jgi:hypothetical protein
MIEDVALEIHLEDASSVGRIRLQIATVHNVKKAISREGERPWAADLLALPLLNELSMRIENLDSRITAIGDVNAVLVVDRDSVRSVEFSRTGALLAPLEQKLPFFVELDDAVVSVTIGDVEFAAALRIWIRILAIRSCTSLD